MHLHDSAPLLLRREAQVPCIFSVSQKALMVSRVSNGWSGYAANTERHVYGHIDTPLQRERRSQKVGKLMESLASDRDPVDRRVAPRVPVAQS